MFFVCPRLSLILGGSSSSGSDDDARGGGRGGGGFAVIEAAGTADLDGTAPLLGSFREFHDLAYASRLLRTLKRRPTLSLLPTATQRNSNKSYEHFDPKVFQL